jgi:ATP-dependent RNA helicase DeaD
LLRRTLSLEHLAVLILDEADRMLSIGFYPDMKEIQRYIQRPVSEYLFSATYPPHVFKLAGEFLADPQMLSLSQGQVHIAQVQHLYCETTPMDKDRALVRLLEVENPSGAIIFCNTKANVHYVAAVLKGFGYNAEELSADLSQARREEVLARLRRGDVRFLVATDVAARGLDIPDLSHVILYEPPEDRESYIHRAGRTGRAGAAGTVISLVDIVQKMELGRIAWHYGMDISQRAAPDDAAVAAVVGERITALLESGVRSATGLQQERMKRFLPLAGQLAANDEQLPLLAMLLDRLYQEHLHKAPPAPSGVSGKPGRAGQAARQERFGSAPRKRRSRGKAGGRS